MARIYLNEGMFHDQVKHPVLYDWCILINVFNLNNIIQKLNLLFKSDRELASSKHALYEKLHGRPCMRA